MSLKKVVLIAAMLALVSPAVTLADGITFGFAGGNISIARPFTLGSLGASSGAVTLAYVTKSSGPDPFGSPTTPTYGTPPVVLGGSSTADIFGTVTFSTGSVIATNGTFSVTFGQGGGVNITSGGTFDTATGNAIPNGTDLFIGYFSGPTTMTWSSFDPLTNTSWYTLTGPVEGNLDPLALTHFGLGSEQGATGFFLTMLAGFVGPTGSNGTVHSGATSVVVVPEPGTLALFGTSLIGIAGLIRRRIKS